MILCECKTTAHDLGCPNRGDGVFVVPSYPMPSGMIPIGGTASVQHRLLTTADVEWLIERIAQRVAQILRAPVDNRPGT